MQENIPDNTEVQKTENERAEELLAKRVSFEEVLGDPNWKEKTFFDSWDKYRKGFRPVDLEVDTKNFSDEEWTVASQSVDLDKLFLKENSPWRTQLYIDSENKLSLMLIAKLNEKDSIYQEIRYVNRFQQGNLKGFAWNLKSMFLFSTEFGDVVNMESFLNNSEYSAERVFIELEEGSEYDESFAYAEDLVVGNIRKEDDLFIFLHELGHARFNEFLLLQKGSHDFSLSNKARNLFNKRILEKISYMQNIKGGELSIEVAHKLVAMNERNAWTFALKVMKEVSENSKISWGGQEDRNKLRKYAEDCLSTYDRMPLTLKELKSDTIPTFSQGNRGKALDLSQQISSGAVSKEKALGQTFDNYSGEYRGANIPNIK